MLYRNEEQISGCQGTVIEVGCGKGWVRMQIGSTKEFLYGDGTALYLDSGDDYTKLYMELNCIEPAHTHRCRFYFIYLNFLLQYCILLTKSRAKEGE